MKSVLLLALNIALISCGELNAEKHYKKGHVDSEFEPYVLEFQRGIPDYLTVKFVESFNVAKRAGQCDQWGSTDRKDVSILKSFWEVATENQRRELIFHELGHCLMGLDHDIRIDEDGYPHSVMYPEVFDVDQADYFEAHRQDYLDELHNSDDPKLEIKQ